MDVERLTHKLLIVFVPGWSSNCANLQSALDSYLQAALPQYHAEMDAVVESVVAEALAKLQTGSGGQPER